MKRVCNFVLRMLCLNILSIVSLFLMTSCCNNFLDIVLDNEQDEIIETHNISDFWDKTYLEYNGGKDAEIFFNEFAYIENYKDIAFHYKDAEKKNSLLAEYYKHTVFVLDVYYERDVFLQVSDKILIEITGQKSEDVFKLYYSTPAKMVPFSGYKVEREDQVYKQNNATILFDPRYNTIRYVFLCNNQGNYIDAKDATLYVLDVHINLNEKDWVFDYSDIASEDYTNHN